MTRVTDQEGKGEGEGSKVSWAFYFEIGLDTKNNISKAYLVKEKFDIIHGEDGPTVIHVLLEVALQVLEDQREGLVGVDDIMQCHWNREHH